MASEQVEAAYGSVEAILDRDEYRYYGVRIEPRAEIGSVLPNSWHNAGDCDWVDEDTELVGTCCFRLQHTDMESFREALSWAAITWPGEEHRMVLIGSNAIGDTALPEEGAECLCDPVVLFAWMESL